MKLQKLLDSPDKWIKCAYARTKDGKFAYSCSFDAYSFCLMGGLHQVYPHFQTRYNIIEEIQKEINTKDISSWNDAPERTFKDIQNLVKKLDI